MASDSGSGKTDKSECTDLEADRPSPEDELPKVGNMESVKIGEALQPFAE